MPWNELGFLLGEDQVPRLGAPPRPDDLAAVGAFEIDVLADLGADLGVEEPGVAHGAVDGEAGVDHRRARPRGPRRRCARSAATAAQPLAQL